ncbi:hypothetical protein IAT38_005606 [Cryptococcus sp. DSM 104549]
MPQITESDTGSNTSRVNFHITSTPSSTGSYIPSVSYTPVPTSSAFADHFGSTVSKAVNGLAKQSWSQWTYVKDDAGESEKALGNAVVDQAKATESEMHVTVDWMVEK